MERRRLARGGVDLDENKTEFIVYRSCAAPTPKPQSGNGHPAGAAALPFAMF